jgi:hypothetical protein
MKKKKKYMKAFKTGDIQKHCQRNFASSQNLTVLHPANFDMG